MGVAVNFLMQPELHFKKPPVKTATPMCGIAAFFSKKPILEAQLGALFAPMLGCLSGRGPDSAGFAIYRDEVPAGQIKVTAQHADPAYDWERLLPNVGRLIALRRISSHVVAVLEGNGESLVEKLLKLDPTVMVMSVGRRMEIFKEKGAPCSVMERFGLPFATGSHAIGHTRMATESAVTTAGSHPFSTGSDICLVHNGSLSNHNRLRRKLQRDGITFRTENDSEVAAGYLAWRLRGGDTLETALEGALRDLDGFFTFAIGTREGFAVLRDPVACKPAVMAETEDYVAMASEYRSLAHLPGVESARLWEPEPGRIYTWSREQRLEVAA